VTDTNGQTITGLTLDYQSTDPIDITAGSGGAVSTSFPGQASVYAICQPSTCNPAPINEIGLNGTGLSVSSNAVSISTPGTASDYVWFAAPGQSQYFVSVELLTGTVGSTVRLPYVPNSMVMDRTGSSLYFGSSRELMIFSTFSNTLTKQDTNVPGVVLAVAPNNTSLLINSQTNVSPTFYIYNSGGSIGSTFPGLGAAAAWTPDSKTLYITDSAALGGAHTDTLYVYNSNTGWTTYPLAASDPKNPETNPGAQNLAITIPGVGAFLSGNPTVAHTWCPTGAIGNYASMSFYPQPPNDEDSVPTLTDVLAATTDGQHILGASFTTGTGITLSDIGVKVPNGECPAAVNGILQPLTIPFTLNPTLNVSKVSASSVSAVNQVIPSPASNLAFVTYSPSTSPEFNAPLPYYVPGTGGAAGTLNYVTLTGSAAITAPVAGAFSPDDKLFFVSTAGDNQIHYISVPTLSDTQQISPNLPACTPSSASDPNCLNTTVPAGGVVPATVITVKPRSTT
jgi:sugar lactone lactonase YvrE